MEVFRHVCIAISKPGLLPLWPGRFTDAMGVKAVGLLVGQLGPQLPLVFKKMKSPKKGGKQHHKQLKN